MNREVWEPESDDEPRSDGRSDLDLFKEACDAADADRVQCESKPNIEQVFAALDAEKFPDGVLTPEDRDNSPMQDRPELDRMFEELEGREDREGDVLGGQR